MTNVIYPMPIIMLRPRHDDFGTTYLPNNIFATQMTSFLGRYIKESDLSKLEEMGFGIIFPNGEPVLPYPHNSAMKKISNKVDVIA